RRPIRSRPTRFVSSIQRSSRAAAEYQALLLAPFRSRTSHIVKLRPIGIEQGEANRLDRGEQERNHSRHSGPACRISRFFECGGSVPTRLAVENSEESLSGFAESRKFQRVRRKQAGQMPATATKPRDLKTSAACRR